MYKHDHFVCYANARVVWELIGKKIKRKETQLNDTKQSVIQNFPHNIKHNVISTMHYECYNQNRLLVKLGKSPEPSLFCC